MTQPYTMKERIRSLLVALILGLGLAAFFWWEPTTPTLQDLATPVRLLSSTPEVPQGYEGYHRLVPSFDGSRVAILSASRQGQESQLGIWETKSGKLIKQFSLELRMLTMNGTLWDLRCSNNARIVIIGNNRSYSVWNTETEQQVLDWTSQDDGAFAVSPDGSLIATKNEETERGIALLSGETGELIDSLTLTGARKNEKNDEMEGLYFSPDGKYLVAQFDDRQPPDVWDLSRKEIITRLYGHETQVRNIVFSADGKLLATRGSHTIRIWETETWQEKYFLAKPSDARGDFAFNEDTSGLWQFLGNGLFVLQDLQSGQPTQAVRMSLPESSSLGGEPEDRWYFSLTSIGVAFQTGHIPIEGSYDLKMWSAIYNLNDAKPTASDKALSLVEVETVPKHPLLIAKIGFQTTIRELTDTPPSEVSEGGKAGIISSEAVTISPDGKTAVAFGDREILVFNSRDGSERRTLEQPEAPFASGKAITWTADSRTIATIATSVSDFPKEVVLLEIASGKFTILRPEIPFKSHSDHLKCLALSPDGSRLAYSVEPITRVYIADVKTRAIEQSLAGPKGERLSQISFSPDGKTLEGNSRNGNSFRWDLSHAEEVIQPETLNRRLEGVSIISTENGIGVSSEGKRDVKIWSVEKDEVIDTWQTPLTNVRGITLSPDGRFVAAWPRYHRGVDYSAVVYIYDVQQRKLHTTLWSSDSRISGRSPVIRSVAFSNDSTRVITNESYAIRIWKNIEYVDEPVQEKK